MRLNSTWVDSMAVISVPKTPKTAYDPRRPAGTLLQNQIRHLEWAIRPAGKRVDLLKKIKPAKTEAEAAARIAKLTSELQRQSARPQGTLPPLPATKQRARKKTANAKRRSAKATPKPRSRRPSRRKAAR
jgi:hypothetical protein